MKLPRDLSGEELARILRRYGYEITRQTGSHLRLTSRFKTAEHHLTIPRRPLLKVGTIAGILADVADYLETEQATLAEALFT